MWNEMEWKERMMSEKTESDNALQIETKTTHTCSAEHKFQLTPGGQGMCAMYGPIHA